MMTKSLSLCGNKTDFMSASQAADYLGMSLSYFYKLRTTAPELLPPPVSGITRRPIWSKRMVDYWISVREEKTKQIIDAQIKELKESQAKRVGRPRKCLVMGGVK